MTRGVPKRASAAVSDGQGGVRIAEVEVASPGPGEVTVEITAAGICHTDLDSTMWGRRLVLGHEGAGVVRAVGDGVDIELETPVVLNWAIPCGRCFHCAAGRQSLCERRDDAARHPDPPRIDGAPVNRSFWLGTMSTATVVRAEALVPTADSIAPRTACAVGCAVMTGYGSVVNAARVRAGTTVVVLGLGSVGLCVVQAAQLSGARRVIGIDRSTARLEMSTEFGTTDTIEVQSNNLAPVIAQVRELTEGRGADYAFECTGAPDLATALLALVRHGGTAIQISGNETTIPVDLSLFEWDKVYLNPLYGQCRPQQDIPRILELYSTGRFDIDKLISRTYRLDEIETAFDDLRNGRIVKGVVELSGR